MIKLIAAHDKNMLMGNSKTNSLPWYWAEEMQFFRRMTLNQVVIMGRKTFDSFKRPLQDRQNIVITSSPKFFAPTEALAEVWWYSDLEKAIHDAHNIFPAKDIWIIGGRSLYAAALARHLAEKMYISELFGAYEGDIYFPAYSYEKKELFFSGRNFNTYEITGGKI